MTSKPSSFLVAMLLVSAAAGACMDPAATDEGALPPVPGYDAAVPGDTGGGGTQGGGTQGGGVQGGGTQGGGTQGGGGTPGGTDVDAGATGDAGAVGDGGGTAGDGGGGAGGGSAVAAIIGSGKNCSTYGLKMGDKCAGVYCGVTEPQLAAAFEELPDRLCKISAAWACEGATVRKVGDCAREVKSANPLNNNAQNRPLVQACVYKDASIMQNVTPECLSCYLDSAICSGDKCLVECIAGNSKSCDDCRLRNNCSQPVAPCTGLPNPL